MTGRLPSSDSLRGLQRPDRLRRDAVFVATGQLAAVMSALAFTVVGARLLSTEEFGALSWALSWLAFLAALGQFGLTQVATIALARSDTGAPGVVVRRLLVAQSAAAALVALLWWLAVGPVAAAAGTPSEVYRPLVVVVAVWLPAAALGPVVVNALRARGRFGWSVVFGEHIRRVLLVAVLVVTALSAAGATLLPALWWAVAFETVVYVTAVVVLLGVARRDGSTAGDSAPAGSSWALLRWGGAFTVVTLTSAAIPQAGIWLLAGFAPVEEVAVLSVAVRIALLLITPAALVMRTLAPRIAAAHEAGRLPVLEDVLRRSAVWSTAATALAVAVIAATGSWLLPRVFGPAYADALPPTLLLAVGVLVNAWTGPCSVLLSHAGHQRTVAISSLVSGVAFCGLSVWWGRLGGADGVAAAAAVVMSVRNLWLAGTARRVLGVRTIAVPRHRKE